MRSDYHRIIKNTLFLYIRMLVLMGLNLYITRVVLGILGVTDFGVYNLVGSTVTLLSFLYNTISGGTQRYLICERSQNNQNGLSNVFSTSVLLHIFIIIIIVIFLETVGLWFVQNKMNIPENRQYSALIAYHLSILAMVLTILQSPYNAIIIAHERMNVFAWMSMVEAVLKLFMIFMLSQINFDKLILYCILIVLINGGISLSYFLYCKFNYSEYKFRLKIDTQLFKSISCFSAWNLIGSLAVLAANNGINILLNLFFGPVANAARGISAQASGALNQFVNNFQTAVNPQIIKHYAERNYAEERDLLYYNAKYAYILLWLLALPVIVEMEYILKLWVGNPPENTVIFCRLLIIQNLIYSLDRPFVIAMHAKGDMKIPNLTSGVVLLLVLPISYLCLKNGMVAYSPFVVYIFATLICFVIEIILLRSWIELSIYNFIVKVIVPVISISSIVSLSTYSVINIMEQSFLRVCVVTVVSSIFTLGILYALFMSKTEQSVVNKLMLRFMNRK